MSAPRKYWVSCKGELYSPIYAPNKREALRWFAKWAGWHRLPRGTECGLVGEEKDNVRYMCLLWGG